MSIQRIITITMAVVTVATAGASAIAVKFARQAQNFAACEAEQLRASVNTLKDENREIREILARTNEAVSRATHAIEEAAVGYAKRAKDIEAVDPDWLMCPLPDGLSDLFRDGQGGADKTAGGSDGAVR